MLRAGVLSRGLRLGNLYNRTHPLHRGLVAWWLVLPGLSGASLLRDLAGTQHLGRTNTPAWIGSHGRRGGFGAVNTTSSGDRYITGTFTSISTSSPFSLGCWLATPDSSGTQTAFSLVDTNNNLAVAIMHRSGSVLKVEGWGAFSNPVLSSTTTAAANVWYRVDYTWDGTTGRIYVNGREEGNNTTAPQSFTPTIASIGKFSTNFDNWTGWLDDATVHNRALSAAEVMDLYQTSVQGYPGRLHRMYWPIVSSAAAAAFDPVNFPWMQPPPPVVRPSRVIAF